MPKERFHMLLADRVLEATRALGGSLVERGCREDFLMGSIMPDLLFYDLPNFSLSLAGRAVHRYQGRKGIDACRRWIEIQNLPLDPHRQAWILGLASHFISDGFWHPHIVRCSEPPFWPCEKIGLTKKSCHHWLESELEAQWIPVLGPPDGYRTELIRFRRMEPRVRRCLNDFVDFLRSLDDLHRIRRIAVYRCFYWQTTLLMFFSHTRAARWHERLITRPFYRPLAALLVPSTSKMRNLLADAPEDDPCRYMHPFDGRLLAQSVIEVAKELVALQRPEDRQIRPRR